jgi:hypothetical protein
VPWSYGSYGCIVAEKTFIDQIGNILGNKDVDFDVRGFNPTIGLTLEATKNGVAQGNILTAKKGDEITMKVRLTGDPNGVSKDCRVFIGLPPGVTTSNLVWNKDQQPGLNPDLFKGTVTNDANKTQISGWYLEIKAGQTESKPFTVKVKADGGTPELRIKNYVFDSPNLALAPHRWYSDYLGTPKVLLKNGGDFKQTFDLRQSLDNLQINTSGGFQGFHKTYNATPGVTYHVTFDPFTVPDSIKVSDVGHTYIKTGFISNPTGTNPFQANFTVAPNSTRVTFDIVGSDPSTSWNLSVNRVALPFPVAFTASAADDPVSTNQAPVATASDLSVRPHEKVGASSLFSASDADGDEISKYQLWDATRGMLSGHFEINGVAQGKEVFEVTAAQLVNTKFIAGTVADQLAVRAFDGAAWSDWKSFQVDPAANSSIAQFTQAVASFDAGGGATTEAAPLTAASSSSSNNPVDFLATDHRLAA